MESVLQVADIFYSIQGESTWAGYPCAFVRLAGCNLSCTYCDTPAAGARGETLSVSEVVDRLAAYKCPLVEVTGGEPLWQAAAVDLCRRLLERRFTVLLETNGTYPLENVPPGVVTIMDIKTPSSGMERFVRPENAGRLRPPDQLKFVVADRRDFDWACAFLDRHPVPPGVEVLLSPVTPGLPALDLADWILESGRWLRLQIQLHKYLNLP